jgi:hypothetical protein
MHRLSTKQRILLWSVSILAATWAATAAADSPNLKGAYGFTGTAVCLVAPGGVPGTSPLPNPTPGVALPNSGFNTNLQPNDSVLPGVTSTAFTLSSSVEGIRTFNGDGTGTVKGTAVAVVGRPTPGPDGYPHFAPHAESDNFSFSFTYTVNGDGSWTATMVPGSYTETVVTGPRAGQTATVDAIPPITGLISGDGKTLIAAHTTPTVETKTFMNGDIVGDVEPAICHRSRVFINLPNGN